MPALILGFVNTLTLAFGIGFCIGIDICICFGGKMQMQLLFTMHCLCPSLQVGMSKWLRTKDVISVTPSFLNLFFHLFNNDLGTFQWLSATLFLFYPFDA